MKFLKTTLSVALLFFFATACKNTTKKAQKETKMVTLADADEAGITLGKKSSAADYKKLEMTIEGMVCSVGCAGTIQKKLSGLKGVKSAEVNFEKKLAMVEFDPSKITKESIVSHVLAVGKQYKVTNVQLVKNFSTDKSVGQSGKKKCGPNCTKACCRKKSMDANKS